MKRKTSRRAFTKLSLSAGLSLSLAGITQSSCTPKAEEVTKAEDTETKKLNILILGGTSFLGPHQIAYAMKRGHSITTFTRGKTIPTLHKDLFDQVEALIGDREDDLSALENRKWDAVIDNSGRKAKWTKDSATALKENVGIYLYTSSTGVYYPYLETDIKEDAELVLAMPEGIKDKEMKMEYGYGIMKANSELEAIKAFGEDRTIIVRPTYMVGPADKTNRFIHWPIRLSQGGEVLVPGKANDPVQYIDVRDVAAWMIRLIEMKKAGTFNVVGPKESQNMYKFVEEAKNAFDVATTFVKIDDYEFLKTQGVPYLIPWILPEGNNRGSAAINNQKGIENGLTFRPLTETMKDTYDWWYSNAVNQEQRNQVEKNPDSVLVREKSIIEAWKSVRGDS